MSPAGDSERSEEAGRPPGRDPATSPPPATSYSQRVRSLIHSLAHAFAAAEESRGHAGYSPGDLAQLRRLDPQRGTASAGDAFWRILVHELEPRGLVRESASGDELRPWMAILQSLSTLRELHRPKARLGRAMAAAEVSEARLTRLLRARGDALLDQLRPLAHQLRSKAQPADWSEAALLVLRDRFDDAERNRQRIASDYYRRQARPSKAADS